MFCPNCDGYILERDLIKTRVKKFGDADIEYEAVCPLCSIHIGKISWGKLIESPYIASAPMFKHQGEDTVSDIENEIPFLEPNEQFDQMLETPQTEVDSFSNFEYQPQSFSNYLPEQVSGHYCPHCGGELPNDINLLPRRMKY